MSRYVNRLFAWYFSRKALPYWCILIMDCLTVYLCGLLVYTLNNGVTHTVTVFHPLCAILAFYLVFYVIGFRVFHTYSGIIRYSSFVDLQRLAFAMLLGLVLSLFARSVFNLNEVWLPVRAKDMIIATLLALSLGWGLRVLVKYLYDTLYSRGIATKAFVYGVHRGGASIAKAIRNQDPPAYTLAGFVTDEPQDTTHYMMGVRVYPNDEHLPEVMQKADAKALFVSPLRTEALRDNPAMVNRLIEAGIKIYVLPTEQEWDGKSETHTKMMREVAIEDLLPRQKIEVDMDAIALELADKVILVSGAAGSIGSEIVRQLAEIRPRRLVLIDQAETPLHDIRLMLSRDFPFQSARTVVADITNRQRMSEIMHAERPDIIFHAAAYKHVPMMEDNPAESVQNNVEGTRILADLAVRCGTEKFVMISTDKAVNPTNVMGCSKRICEIYVQSLDRAIRERRVKGRTRFVTTRFGNVLGSNGSVIPLFRQQILNGGPITVTHPEIIRYFMLIPEACRLVLEAGTHGHGGEIFVFDMGEPVKIVDLARRMISLSGANIEIRFTGLREGEKLYEEVLNDKEKVLPSFHPKIKIARVREYDYEDVRKEIDILYASSLADDAMTVVRHMKAIVPEYISQNSVYQKLDK